MVTGASQAASLPCSLRKIRIGPHSQASTNSGLPSPSRSLNTAPLTRPNFSIRCLSTQRPPSFFNNSPPAGSGYRPATTRPPTNNSSSPSPSMSPSASGPTLYPLPRTLSPLPFPIVAIRRQLSAPTAADHQILPPVPVHVIPPHPGSQLTQLPGQQSLPLEIIEPLLMMRMPNQLTHLCEHGRLRVEGRWSLVVGFGLSTRLLHFVDPVGSHAADHAPLAAAPRHLYPHLIAQCPGQIPA